MSATETCSESVPHTYIDWHCTACGFEHEATGSSYALLCNCPSCGKSATRQGFHRLPVNQATRDAEPHQYDFCSNRKDVQVYLTAATGERTGQTMHEEWVPDCNDDPVSVAEAVLVVCKTKYLFCGGTDKVAAVVAAMRACTALSAENARINRMHDLRKALVLGMQEYADLLHPIEED